MPRPCKRSATRHDVRARQLARCGFLFVVVGHGSELGHAVVVEADLRPESDCDVVWRLLVVVVGCAYAIDKPLIPPGVEPAGHTHAFDVYSNPFGGKVTLTGVRQVLEDSVGWAERASCLVMCVVAALGLVLREPAPSLASEPSPERSGRGLDRDVPPSVVGLTGLIGLIALSIVGCYAYYPSAEETLEEMRLARTETLSSANSGNVEDALRWLEVWEQWSRRLEVGTFLRKFEVRPYQQMQAYILRKKLELLEHELEHEELDKAEISQLMLELTRTSQRLSRAFQT